MSRFSAIFKDETKLDTSYIPVDLPNREKQLEKLQNHFSGTLSDGMPYTFQSDIIFTAFLSKKNTLIKATITINNTKSE